MAYEYDRFDREEGGGASFLMGLLAGTVLGAGLGMLFAPRTGSELRSRITEQAGTLRHRAGDMYNQASEKVGHMVDRGREAYERAREAAGGPTGTSATGGAGMGPGGLSSPTSTPGSFTTNLP
jgi:hypothetical protein